MADINLTMGVRTNLLELRTTDKLLARTNERLASGKDVNSAIDNPVNFFASMSLTDRATGLEARLDGIGQAVQTLKAAESGVKGVRTLFANMEALVNQARDEVDIRARRTLGEQFNELMEQAQELAKDSSYQGTNLLQNNERLTVQFADRFDQSLMKIDGINVQGPGIGGSGMKNDAGEVPPSEVVGIREIASQPSTASLGSVAYASSQTSRASSASRPVSASAGGMTAIASASSVSSTASIASQGAVSALPPQGSIAARAAQPSVGTVASTSSEASVASRPAISSAGSVASAGAVGSLASIASRAAVASAGSVASIAAQTIVQQYAFTLNVTLDELGTDQVIGIQSHGQNSIATGEHEVDWGSPKFKDHLQSIAIQLEKFDNALRVELSNIATNTSVLNIREEFTEEMRTTLLTGSDKLVLADMNDEGANLLALQTRQQLGLEALNLATQQSQQLLRLLQ